jgi:hypothetical protein
MTTEQKFPCMMFYVYEDVNATDVVSPKVPTREEHKVLYSYDPGKITSDYDEFVRQHIEQETVDQTFVNQKPRKILSVAITDESAIKLTEQREGFVRWVR